MTLRTTTEWLLADSALPLLHRLQEAERPEALGSVTPSAAAEMTVRKGRARIPVVGMLLPERSEFLDYFDIPHTSYADIQAQVAAAEADSEVTAIDFDVASPGGTVAGFYDAARAIAGATKPTRALVTDAASAAYGLASQTGEVVALKPETSVGSVGVAVTVRHPNSSYATTVTSTAAPDKVPDPTTEKGVDVIRARLDDLHAMFAGTIAAGRGTTTENVNASFGGGRVFLAKDALARGMIDSIAAVGGGESNTTAESAQGGAATTTRRKMDLETFKAEHPELFRAAVAQGLETGRQEERKRCADHLKLGESAGALDVAHKAIASGASLADCQADYMAASLNRGDIQAMRDGDAQVAKAADGASGSAAAAKASEEAEKAQLDEFLEGFASSGSGKVITRKAAD